MHTSTKGERGGDDNRTKNLTRLTHPECIRSPTIWINYDALPKLIQNLEREMELMSSELIVSSTFKNYSIAFFFSRKYTSIQKASVTLSPPYKNGGTDPLTKTTILFLF
ncbi:hypothetical protein TWF225_011611 [Orbilia oligospora]|uniref:Uncharacterized protein n=1 Tax=Orbilia oligospora TaxID=2813651 RepID=A0A7C8KC92_ORBOL|nr:hypothetical protein TWF751_007597 [Orbilia oligospora]KAF3192815.1 hypothetical protein TWF225_011611 [Orbilia oligospora]KAF3247187.1 hypothetical protein TWF128_008683 [Orbilia oligospora]KAF3262839.1 hypothetical protein TWF217_004131 [Orbilia oligospora]KAF3284470.1 hypothetical protein TWF132_009760 [Orbilia oligospora]